MIAERLLDCDCVIPFPIVVDLRRQVEFSDIRATADYVEMTGAAGP